jgi:uncharacterized membrane protein
MLSLRLESVNRILGSLLLLIIGALVTLLILTYRGSAVPDTFYEATVVSYTNTATYPAVVEGPFVVSQQVVVEWHKQPIRIGAEIAAGVTVILGILYLVLKRLYRQMSEEDFP